MEISQAHNFMVSALNSRATRQKLIASNIANIDTPFYKSRDIAFEKALSNEAKKAFSEEKNTELEMAKTSSNHFDGATDEVTKPTIFFRDGHASRNDGNSVDLDVETTEMSKNSTMFNALIGGIKKNKMIFHAMLDASAKSQ